MAILPNLRRRSRWAILSLWDVFISFEIPVGGIFVIRIVHIVRVIVN